MPLGTVLRIHQALEEADDWSDSPTPGKPVPVEIKVTVKNLLQVNAVTETSLVTFAVDLY